VKANVQNLLAMADLDDFVTCCGSTRARRKETERFKRFEVADLLKRDKINLDIIWRKDDSLDGVDKRPPPDEIAAEIVRSLQAPESGSVRGERDILTRLLLAFQLGFAPAATVKSECQSRATWKRPFSGSFLSPRSAGSYKWAILDLNQ
jgi:hypothetical protein